MFKPFSRLMMIGLLALQTAYVQAEDRYEFSGTLDLGYVKDYDDKTKFGSISRSNIAFDVSKDLSADLTLTGKIDTRFFVQDPDTQQYLVNEDSKYLGSAEATIGLKGNWGQVRAGRALTSIWNNDGAYDAWYNYDSIASPAWWLWHGNSPADPNASSKNASVARLNNGIFYTSPTFNGFSVDASYGVVTQPEDLNHSVSVAVKYNQKEYGVMLAYERTPTGNVDNFLAGKVNVGNLSLMAAYDNEQLQGGGQNRSFTASARYTRGAMSYMLGAGLQQDYSYAKFYGAGVSYTYKPNLNIYFSYGNRGQGLWGSAMAKDAYGVGLGYSF